MLSVDLLEAVTEASILVSIDTLHLGLHDIDRVVCHGGAETCESTGKKIDNNRDRDGITEDFLSVFEDDEAHTLVGGLLHQSRNDTLVAATEALSLYNRVDTVEKITVLGLRGQLVVNELGFESLLRGDDNNSLSSTGADTTKEVVGPSALSENILLHVGVGAEAHVVLRHGEHEQSGVALVEAEEAIGLHRVLDHIDGTHCILVLVELHDSLCVLGRVRA